jgi:hypothetical protein
VGDTGSGEMEPSGQVWLNDLTHYRGTRMHIVGFCFGTVSQPYENSKSSSDPVFPFRFRGDIFFMP